MSSFQSAYQYLVHGIQLLDTQCWRDEYDLSLHLYNAAAEVAYCSGRSDKVHDFVQEILDHATCLEDTFGGHAAKIYAFGSSGLTQEAIQYGLNILGLLGERFPARPSMVRTFLELQRIRHRLKKKPTSRCCGSQ